MDTIVVKKVLDKREDFLRRHLVLSDSVIDKLYQCRIITDFTKSKLQGQKSDHQVTILLGCLKFKGISVFRDFLSVLRDTFHGWIADEILDTEITGYDVAKRFDEPAMLRDFLNRKYHEVSHPGFNIIAAPGFNQFGDTQREAVKQSIGFQEQHKQQRVQYVINPAVYDEIVSPETDLYGQPLTTYHIPGEVSHRNRRQINKKADERRHESVIKIPGHIQDLESEFAKERSSAQHSMSVLRQEEMSIKGLLQQNQREQKDLLAKENALLEIQNKMRQISEQSTKLYKRHTDIRKSQNRLAHLQRVPWSGDNDSSYD